MDCESGRSGSSAYFQHAHTFPAHRQDGLFDEAPQSEPSPNVAIEKVNPGIGAGGTPFSVRRRFVALSQHSRNSGPNLVYVFFRANPILKKYAQGSRQATESRPQRLVLLEPLEKTAALPPL